MDIADQQFAVDPGGAVAYPLGAPKGAAAGERGETDTAIGLLHRALAIAQTVVRRGERRYLSALCNHVPALATASLEHAYAARIDAARIAERLADLAGETEVADLSPPEDSAADAREPPSVPSLRAMVDAHVAAERAAVIGYREIGAFFARFDPAVGMLIEAIAVDAERRAGELARLHERVPKY
jgi:hypothetical protein